MTAARAAAAAAAAVGSALLIPTPPPTVRPRPTNASVSLPFFVMFTGCVVFTTVTYARFFRPDACDVSSSHRRLG